MANHIHKGDKTHNQLQFIFPVSLRTINIVNNIPDKPILPDEELLSLIIILFTNLRYFLPIILLFTNSCFLLTYSSEGL